MYYSKFRVRNYKSYFDSGEITFGPGINIITGQNNAGKTSLLQALFLQFSNNPHKSTQTLSTSLSKNEEKSAIECDINISNEDFSTYIFDYMSQLLTPVEADQNPRKYEGIGYRDTLFKQANVITFQKESTNELENVVLKSIKILHPLNRHENWVYNIDKSTKRLIYSGPHAGSKNSYYQLANLLQRRIYYFHAERLNIGASKFGNSSQLMPNASNLPEVLNSLQVDKIKFKRYVEYVKKIFPQIYDISIRPDPSGNGHVQIVIWNEDPKHERVDLVVPLSECGTGLGQVLAILYVVLTSTIAHIIIIDEPNSFLHPGASRKLIEILKDHSQHQFIIATHSPSTISAANPKTINIIKYNNAQSFVEAVDISIVNEQQSYLAEIGSKLSDVFGSDNVLWVEGKTEEICFPKIVEATIGISLMGTSIISVKNTGDFQTKNSKLIFEVYDKLSKGKGLLPPAVGFIFDREKLTQQQMNDLNKQSSGKVAFIERMMYENYLINPEAIASVLNIIPEIQNLSISYDTINTWIQKNKWNKKYINQKYSEAKNETTWLKQVNGAGFLSDMFSSLTGNTLQYDKIKHSVVLTEWIIKNSSEDLKEIQSLLIKILK
ncbi:MAG: AAA family ATPase [Bacteroidia bacterium]